MPDPAESPPAVKAEPPAIPASTSEVHLAAARRRRRELQTTLVDLERVLAAPAPGRPVAWASAVRDGLDRLRLDLERHVDVTEGDGGLYRDVLTTAPRLANAVARLEREHARLRDALAAAVAVLESPAEAEGWVASARDEVTALISLFSRHRQRGADLVYEAYESDIGGTG